MISGARAPIALELARSFKAMGHRVIMIDCLHLTIARWSNSVCKYYFVPSPRFQNELFVSKIQEIIRLENVTHFIPTCEEAIFVSQNKDRFACKVWTTDLGLMLHLHNKYTFASANRCGFPVPKTILLTDFDDWGRSESYVFKPIYSRFASSVIIRKKINRQYFKETDKHRWVAQEFIAGKEICVYSIWDNGKLKAYAAYHPLYRAGKGAGVFFEPVANDVIFEYVKTAGSKLNYTGQLSFDVILSKDGTPYFIECNPRGTSGGHLINKDLADAFLGSNTYINTDKQEFSIKYAMAILHLHSFAKKRVWKSKDIIFKWNDLTPFFLQLISLIEVAYLKFTQKTSWLGATTRNIEWNGYEN